MKKTFLSLVIVSLIANCIVILPCAYAEDSVAEETVIYEQNFDSYDSGTSFSDFSAAERNNSVNGVSASWERRFDGYSSFQDGEGVILPNGLDGRNDIINEEGNSVIIENGRLKMSKAYKYTNHTAAYGAIRYATHNYTMVNLMQPSSQYDRVDVSGIVKVSFDIQVADNKGYGTNFMSVTRDGGAKINNMCNGASIYLGHQSDGGAMPLGGAENYFSTDKVSKIELIMDYDQHLYWGYCDGILTTGAKPINKYETSMNGFCFDQNCQGAGTIEGSSIIYIDNFKISKLTTPNVTASYQNNQTGTEIAPPRIDFNIPMSAEKMSNIKLYENGTELTDSSFTLSEDGMYAVFGKELKYSTPYELKVNGVTATGGIGALNNAVIAKNCAYLSEKSIKFHTRHKPSNVTANVTIKDYTTGEIISDLSAASKVKAELTCQLKSGSNAEPIVFIISLFRSGEHGKTMEQITCKSLTVTENGFTDSKGNSLDGTIIIELPENKNGLSISAFVWDSHTGMKVIDAN